MNFVAIDVETANPNMASICQIGLAVFDRGQLVRKWSVLIDPEDYFDDVNISIHGIDLDMVQGKPTLPHVADQLRLFLEQSVAVCHTPFDRIALSKAFKKYDLSPISTQWLDSARVVRRAWPELAWKGYGLANVCQKIGHEFEHHDALEDAKAAGAVLVAAMRHSQQGLDYWINRVSQPIDITKTSSNESVHRDGNPEGDLFGEILVFTGALEIPRAEAANLAASVGCEVASNVTKKTTILVVGDQDISKLAGHEKSNKHRKAEELVATGSKIRIICESDFKALVKSSNS